MKPYKKKTINKKKKFSRSKDFDLYLSRKVIVTKQVVAVFSVIRLNAAKLSRKFLKLPFDQKIFLCKYGFGKFVHFHNKQVSEIHL